MTNHFLTNLNAKMVWTPDTTARIRWCFTYHYVDAELASGYANVLQQDTKYLIFGWEVCPQSGQTHLQGYAEFNVRKRFTQVRTFFDGTAHWEPAMANADDNIAYCKKEGDFEEYGRPAGNGGQQEQDRWAVTRTAAVTGEYASIPDQIFVCHYGAIKHITKDHMEPPPDLDGPCGVWIYGQSGVGKSRKARADYPGFYLKNANKWWDGYKGQRYVIIDDFDKSHSVLSYYLKIWADRYGFMPETKGGGCAIRPEAIVITSQYSIDEIWEDQPTREALHRRFSTIHMLNANLQ